MVNVAVVKFGGYESEHFFLMVSTFTTSDGFVYVVFKCKIIS